MSINNPCLIWWNEHEAHEWAYTSTGGGHMVDIGSTDEKGYAEWHCPGINYVARHRGIRGHTYKMNTPFGYVGKHEGE
jgi:hypothetical protein